MLLSDKTIYIAFYNSLIINIFLFNFGHVAGRQWHFRKRLRNFFSFKNRSPSCSLFALIDFACTIIKPKLNYKLEWHAFISKAWIGNFWLLKFWFDGRIDDVKMYQKHQLTNNTSTLLIIHVLALSLSYM